MQETVTFFVSHHLDGARCDVVSVAVWGCGAYGTELCCAPSTCVVHQWPVLCTMVHRGDQLSLHNVTLYHWSRAQCMFHKNVPAKSAHAHLWKAAKIPLNLIYKCACECHWGSSETVEPQGCPSCSRLHFQVIVFFLCLMVCWAWIGSLTYIYI